MKKKRKKLARITWSFEDSRWVLYIWDEEDQGWLFSKSWKVKDEDVDSGIGWVSDSILCEIADMQKWGYEVTVWL